MLETCIDIAVLLVVLTFVVVFVAAAKDLLYRDYSTRYRVVNDGDMLCLETRAWWQRRWRRTGKCANTIEELMP